MFFYLLKYFMKGILKYDTEQKKFESAGSSTRYSMSATVYVGVLGWINNLFYWPRHTLANMEDSSGDKDTG